MSTTHLILGERGGVGKSFFSLLLAEYYLSKNRPFTFCDADRSNKDIGKKLEHYTEVLYSYFSEDPNQLESSDLIFESAFNSQRDVVVNCPAQINRALSVWASYGSLNILKETEIHLYFWFITNGEELSINLFQHSLEEFPEVPHILVRNDYFINKRTTKNLIDFSDPKEPESPINELLKKHKTPTITCPDFPGGTAQSLKDSEATFTEAAQPEAGLPFFVRHRILNNLTTLFNSLDTLEVFQNEQRPTPEPAGNKKRTRTKKSEGDNGETGDP